MGEAGTHRKKTLYTLGHSTLPFEKFLNLLRQRGIQILADVRSLTNSKLFPEFRRIYLTEHLPGSGITYHHLKELGSRGRKPLARSPNTGLSKPWRVYADYMLTPDFERGIQQLLALANLGTVAVFCAEGDWRQCHRKFIADALQVRGHKIFHLDSLGHSSEHALPPRILIKAEKLTYPAAGEQLSLF